MPAHAESFYISKRADENFRPRPLGGEGGPQPALSPAGAGRVRGSKPNALNPTPPVATTQSSAPFARITPGPQELYRWGTAAQCIPGSQGARPVPHRSSPGSAAHAHPRRARQSGVAPHSRSRHGVFTNLTPSPVRPRLMKTPVAGHPLPQRGEGGDSRIRRFSFLHHSLHHKCTNSRRRTDVRRRTVK